MREVDVDAMLRRIGFPLFQEWLAFKTLDPFGDTRADWRIAALAATIANIKRNPKTKWTAYEPEDFLLAFGAAAGPPRKQSAREQWDNFMLILGDHVAMQKAAKVAKVKRRMRGK